SRVEASEKRPKAGHARRRGRVRGPSSFIRTVTVGSGLGPDLLTPREPGGARGLAGRVAPRPTAGGELHPALKTSCVPAGPARGILPRGREGRVEWCGARVGRWTSVGPRVRGDDGVGGRRGRRQGAGGRGCISTRMSSPSWRV